MLKVTSIEQDGQNKSIQSQWHSAVELAKEVENDEIRYYIIYILYSKPKCRRCVDIVKVKVIVSTS